MLTTPPTVVGWTSQASRSPKTVWCLKAHPATRCFGRVDVRRLSLDIGLEIPSSSSFAVCRAKETAQTWSPYTLRRYAIAQGHRAPMHCLGGSCHLTR